MKKRLMAALAALLVSAACWSVSAPDSSLEEDQAVLQRVEGEARALAGAGGCTDGAQCRTAPVGAKACGGPRTYVVYCATTTDTVALFRKLDELRRAEEGFNQKYGVASNCAFVSPPGTELVGGTCRART
ncbi:MAG TPA: hypothetical protein VF263_23660 [Longimicrobiaceae bacterium]